MNTVKTLTFDLFGTILDLGGSLKPYVADFLQGRNQDISIDTFWAIGPESGRCFIG